jgi:hypothetical protein
MNRAKPTVGQKSMQAEGLLQKTTKPQPKSAGSVLTEVLQR